MRGDVMPAWPWVQIPRLPRRRRLVDVLYAFYATVVVTLLWVGLLAEPLRSVLGSIPEGDRAWALAWPLFAVLVLALASGRAGGPWVLRRGTAAWVVTGRSGPVVLARAMLVLVAVGATAGGLLGWVIIVVTEDGPSGVVGIGTGAVLAVIAVVIAALVQPGDRIGVVGGAVVAAAVAALGASSLLTGLLGGAAAVGLGAAGAAVACALAVGRGGRVRPDRLERRARALAPLGVVLSERDLRSLTLLGRALTGEAPRPGPGPAGSIRRAGARRRRITASLRRSSPRRLLRLGLLVGTATWGWWLLWSGAPVGIAPVAGAGWLVGLDLAEPLAQEQDRPSLVPDANARHLLAHAAGIAVAALPVLAAPAALLAPVAGVGTVGRALLVVLPGLTLATAAAAVHSLVRKPVAPSAIVLPEALLSSLVLREGAPAAIVSLGLAPLVAHERLVDGPLPVAAVPGGIALGAVALVVVVSVARVRDRRSLRVQRVEVAP